MSGAQWTGLAVVALVYGTLFVIAWLTDRHQQPYVPFGPECNE